MNKYTTEEERIINCFLFLCSVAFLTQICGNVGCCYTPWLQGSFTEGGIDFFNKDWIGQCAQFNILIEGFHLVMGKYIHVMLMYAIFD